MLGSPNWLVKVLIVESRKSEVPTIAMQSPLPSCPLPVVSS